MPAPLLPVVWSGDVQAHVPAAEIWVGVRTPGTEVPARADVLRAGVLAAGAELEPARRHDGTLLRRVHDVGLLRYLETAYAEWEAAGLPQQAGQDRVVPYVFPTAAMLAGMPAHPPAAAHGRAGLYCYDTMTLVGPGTWRAAVGAVDAALTAADLVAEGAPAAYALTRPPGHHAAPAGFGGSCYLNNAACAVEALLAHGRGRVAVVDVDAHHGNGTQAVFYDRGDVLYGSLHVDPAAGWFPHYLGHADERGAGEGEGTTCNVPLRPGTGDAGWLDALARLLDEVAAFQPAALVVSLGVDAGADDPESPLVVGTDGFARAGELLAGLGLPTVLVQEGGYALDRLAADTVAVLSAFPVRAGPTGPAARDAGSLD